MFDPCAPRSASFPVAAISCAGIALAGVPGIAHADIREVYDRVGGWAIYREREHHSCSAVAGFDGPGDPAFHVLVQKDVAVLLYENSNWTHRTERFIDLEIRLDDGERVPISNAKAVRHEGGTSAIMFGMQMPEFERFAAASSIAFTTGGIPIGSFDLGDNHTPMLIARACVQSIYYEEGKAAFERERDAQFYEDPFAAGPAVADPVLLDMDAILERLTGKVDDLWRERQRRARRYGEPLADMNDLRARVSLAVDTEGRATRCELTGPSSDADYDRIVCEVLTGEARFEPARDANGIPTDGVWSKIVANREPD